jgi:hypothetical protein
MPPVPITHVHSTSSGSVGAVARSDGRLLLSWGNRGSSPGEFIGPKGVQLDQRHPKTDAVREVLP